MMKMSKIITTVFAAMIMLPLLCSSSCHAGLPKTGGGYEIMADAVTKAGMAPVTGGNMRLYNSIGQQAGYVTAAGGRFEVVGGFLGVVDETPPAISFSTPADSSAVTGSVGVEGMAFDQNGATWTVYYGPGESPSRWKQIGTGNDNEPNCHMADWDTSNLYGTYTLKIVGVDARGNSAAKTVMVGVWSKYDFTTTIPADVWSMVAVPGNPLNPDPYSFLGSARYEVQRWDPTMQPNEANTQYKIIFPVTAGDGFWIKPYKAPITMSLSAWVQDTTTNFEKHVDAGWNQIGLPFNRSVTFGNFSFRRDGDAASVPAATAVQNGWLGSAFYSYATNTYVANDVNAALRPFYGYYVRAYSPGTIVLDPGAGLPGGMARAIRPSYVWKLQITADTDVARDTENYIGEMRGATDTFNSTDAAEPPIIDPYVSLYFPHDEWGMAAGRYAADIRSPQDDTSPLDKDWTFVVGTNEKNKPVKLSWPNISSVPGNYIITIRDVAAQKNIDPRNEPDYSFTTGADGKGTFKITAHVIGAAAPGEPVFKTAFRQGWSLFSAPIEPSQTDARKQFGAALPHVNVYQYYDRRLNAPDSAGRVDIQAGVGYWANADAPVEAEFHGAPTNPGTPVDVPLADGWNIIGNPFNSGISFGDNISVTRDGKTVPMSGAVSQGWLDGRLYRYSGEEDTWKILGPGSTMQPWEGYVLKSYGASTLRFVQ